MEKCQGNFSRCTQAIHTLWAFLTCWPVEGPEGGLCMQVMRTLESLKEKLFLLCKMMQKVRLKQEKWKSSPSPQSLQLPIAAPLPCFWRGEEGFVLSSWGWLWSHHRWLSVAFSNISYKRRTAGHHVLRLHWEGASFSLFRLSRAVTDGI